MFNEFPENSQLDALRKQVRLLMLL